MKRRLQAAPFGKPTACRFRQVTCKCKKKAGLMTSLILLSGRQDSNLRPSEPHSDTLPSCATPRTNVQDAIVGCDVTAKKMLIVHHGSGTMVDDLIQLVSAIMQDDGDEQRFLQVRVRGLPFQPIQLVLELPVGLAVGCRRHR